AARAASEGACGRNRARSERMLERGDRPERGARRERSDDGEYEHRSIERNVFDSRQIRRRQRRKQLDPAMGESETRRASEETEHETFAQQLRSDRLSTRAERSAN